MNLVRLFLENRIVGRLSAKSAIGAGGVMKRMGMFLAVAFAVAILGGTAQAQTTYTWQGANNASWATAGNWTPTRTTPATNDVLQFNTGTTLTITAVPAQTIGRFVMSNSTNITLQAAAGITLTIGNGTGTDLDVPSGSALTQGTNVNVTLATSATADIAGTLTITTGRTYSTNGTTVVTTVTGIVTAVGAVTSTTATKLLFQGGSTYTHAQNAGTIPTATWNASSTCEVTGVVGSGPTGMGQAFGNFRWNNPGETGDEGLPASGMSMAGNFEINSTGGAGDQLQMAQTPLTVAGDFLLTGGEFRMATNTARTLTVTGNAKISGGLVDMSTGNSGGIGTLDVAGDFEHTAGTITETGSASNTIVFNGTGARTYTGGGTVSQTVNFTLNKTTGSMTLATNVVISSSTLTVTSGTFDQGASFDLTVGAITVSAGGALANLGTGDLTLGGNVSNSGVIYYNGSGSGCPETDAIVIGSTSTTVRSWSGAGTFRMVDVSVNHQSVGTPPGSITAYSSTDGGSNTNWVFTTDCVNAPTDVAMVSLKATRFDNRVLLEWRTGYEVRNLGFNIYREQKGSYSKINPEPVAGSALLFGPKVSLRTGNCGLRIEECGL